MKRFFDNLKNSFANTHEKVRAYWNRSLNHSNRTKGSEGLQQANKLITVAHKDQWRKNSKKSE